MTILGLDPGLERVGYGLVRREGSRLVAVDHGLLQTPRIELPDRLQMLFEGLSELIARHRPEAAALEKLLFAVNKTNAMDVARASGVLLLACRQADVPVSEITPPEVKLAGVGNGAAEKRQVQFMVAKLLGLRETPKPDDVADALAVAIAHAMRSRTPLPMP
jgi:crossover junction endodeoxyribonuclease RuvC